MYAANNTLEETIGLATAANTILQNPQSVGTTLKTVSMYVRAAKTELEAAGEETEGIAESTGKLRELIMAITREGGKAVDIMADENRFKSTFQILEEISEVWDKISDTNQAALLEKLGGKRNANAIAAILENFDIARKAMEAASNAEGSALTELAKYQESIEGHMVALKTAFQELSSAVVDGDLVKTVIDIGRYTLEFLTGVVKLIDKLGGLRTVLIAITGMSIVKNITSASKALSVVAAVMGAVNSAARSFLTGGTTYADVFEKIGASASKAQIAIGALTAALTIASAAYAQWKRSEQERISAAKESSEASKTEIDEINELLESYDKLSVKVQTDDSVKDEYAKTVNKLAEKLGIEKNAVDELAGSYENMSTKILEAAIKKSNELLVDLRTDYANTAEEITNPNFFDKFSPNAIRFERGRGRATATDELLAYRLVSEGLFGDVAHFSPGQYGDFSSGFSLTSAFDTESIEGFLDAYERLGEALQRIDETPDISDYFRKQIADMRTFAKERAEALIDEADAINTEMARNAMRQAQIERKTFESLGEYRDYLFEYVTDGGKYAGRIEDVNRVIDELIDKSSGLHTAVSSATGAVSEDFNKAATVFNDFKKEIGILGNVLGEFQEHGSVAAETFNELTEGTDKYNDLFTYTGNGIELVTDKLNTYVESLEQEYGAKMAAAGATSDEIGVMVALGNTLVTTAEDSSNAAAEIKELRGYIDKLNEGAELSWDEIQALQKKYPKLTSAVKEAGKGYRIETSALEELIAVKSQYIRLTETESAVVQARNMLSLKNGGNTTAVTSIENIFTNFEVAHGRLITSMEDFAEGYALAFGESFEGVYDEYLALVEAMIQKNQTLTLEMKLQENAVEDTMSGYDPKVLDEVAKNVETLTSELEGLHKNLVELNEGTEYSTGEIITLLTKYPSLRDHIIKTANGYKIETSAIKELIAAKVQLITTTEQETRVASARASLVSATKDANADKADVVFADYMAKNGKNIETIEEYKAAYKAYYGYAAKASLAYAQAKIDAFADAGMDAVMVDLYNDYLNDDYMEGYKPDTSSSSTKDEETEFEKAYKLHQHYVAMNQETEEQYLNWLDGAYKASYAAGEMELDDYYKYEEEVYEKRKQLFQTSLDEMQHQIDLLSHQTGDTSAEQIAIYEQMQKKVNQQANAYRAQGIKENDELIRELQNQWWQYEDNIRQLRESAFNDWLNDKKFVIDRLKQDNASMDEIVGSWKEVLTRINDEIAYYLSKGYDVTSDVIQSLMSELDSAKESIIEALDEVVSKANEVVDGFQNVYQTLANAGKEYASTGYLSVDSLQSILSLGPQYMDMLYDEAGQLTLNEDALQKIIAARTEEMAAETALSYAKQILLATENDETKTLRELSNIQSSAASNTWDVAYATLGYAKAIGATKGISEDYYDKAFENITKMQSITKTAVDSIGAYYETLQDGYISQADALDQILKLTEDMIKQENSDRIDDLEKEKDLYKDIIDEKKEILRLTKEQNDHDREMADKLKEISDLQSKIDQLALDDSREAGAQRAKLEAELLEKQKALADDQADYAYDAQVDALDKQYDAFEEEKDDEIDALKDMLSSAEKLYQAAISRINNGWDTLYDDLMDWNYNYGSTLQKDLQNAWDRALEAAERYGTFVDALEGTKEYDKIGATHVNTETPSARSAYDGGANVLSDYVNRMRANSIAWFTGDQAYLAGENQRLAGEYKAATGRSLNYKNGLWYEEGSSQPLYNLAKEQSARDQIGNAVVAAMKANSELWKSADGSGKSDLERKNEDLAAKLANFLGKQITKTKAGVWMLGNTPLFDVKKFHTGGIVGGAKTLRQSEVMALLQKGEAVLDEKRETALYKTVDFVQLLSDKIGHAIDKGRLSSLLGGTGASFAASAVPALAGGIGTMNFSPTIQITFANTGDMSESQARKYGNIAAESALQQLKAAFSQRGVGALGNSTLK